MKFPTKTAPSDSVTKAEQKPLQSENYTQEKTNLCRPNRKPGGFPNGALGFRHVGCKNASVGKHNQCPVQGKNKLWRSNRKLWKVPHGAVGSSFNCLENNDSIEKRKSLPKKKLCESIEDLERFQTGPLDSATQARITLQSEHGNPFTGKIKSIIFQSNTWKCSIRRL